MMPDNDETLAPREARKITRGATAVLVARGVPPETAVTKVKSAVGWWVVAGVAAVVCFGITGLGFYLALKKDISTALTIFLGMMLCFPAGVSLFAAHKASGEATDAFIEAAGKLVKIGRTAAKGEGQ